MKAIRCREIYTSLSEQTIDGYVLINNNIIEKIVPLEEWDSSLSRDIIDCENYFLMPGFNDYHVHMVMAAMMEHFGTIRSAENSEEAAKYLYEKNKDKNPEQWILGGAWDHFVWPDQALPTKEVLDKYFPKTPVFSLNKECHGAWLNSEALRRLNITNETPNPPNGEYFKDRYGELTGYIHETAVAPNLAKVLEDISDNEIADFIRSFAKMANRYGITSVGDLPLYVPHRYGAYRTLLENDNLTLRINFSVGMMEDDSLIDKVRAEFNGPIIRFNGVKDFLDGTPMGYTGYMVEPYSDRPGFTSEPIIPEEKFISRIVELDSMGIRCRVHCCGDGAVRLALDAFQLAGEKNGFRDMRHAIEHIEVITPEDINRFSQLGVIASVQPEHSPRTHYSTHPFHHLIGEERMKFMWPFKSLLDSGAHMAFGTDYPVVELSPFKGLFRCINRLTNELEPEGGYNPEQKLTVDEALRNYTWGSAFACGRDYELGTIEAGKLADIIALEENPFKVCNDRDKMFNMSVKMTMMNGNIVYNA